MTLTRSARPARTKFSRACAARFWILLHRHQHAVGRERAGEPDPRVADGGADFENARGADGGGQHAQQRADFRVDQRKVLLFALARDLEKHGVGEAIEPGEVSFDGVRDDLAHN